MNEKEEDEIRQIGVFHTFLKEEVGRALFDLDTLLVRTIGLRTDFALLLNKLENVKALPNE